LLPDLQLRPTEATPGRWPRPRRRTSRWFCHEIPEKKKTVLTGGLILGKRTDKDEF
jgi:hypothetical protein